MIQKKHNTCDYKSILVKLAFKLEEIMRIVIQRILIVLTLLSTTLFGQETSPYEFLSLDVSPRAAALGGSFVANDDDPNVLFYNPAGLKNLENRPISFSFFDHIVDIKTLGLVYSHDFDNIGRFALGVQYVSYGDFDRTTEDGQILGTFGAGDFALTLGYTNQLEENFHYGISLKFIHTAIDDISSSAIAGDVGLQYEFSKKRTIGLSIRNIGTQLSSYFDTAEDLPLDVRIGAKQKLAHLPLTLFLSLNKLNESEERFKRFTFGGEFQLSKVLSLRIGYDNEKRDELKLGSSTAGLAGFSIGLGVEVQKYNVDYAFSSLGDVGAWHRFGISTEF